MLLPFLQLGLHPRDVDRLTVDEFDYLAWTVRDASAAHGRQRQADAVAQMRALGGSV